MRRTLPAQDSAGDGGRQSDLADLSAPSRNEPALFPVETRTVFSLQFFFQ